MIEWEREKENGGVNKHEQSIHFMNIQDRQMHYTFPLAFKIYTNKYLKLFVINQLVKWLFNCMI
jgi:hypothetical protein